MLTLNHALYDGQQSVLMVSWGYIKFVITNRYVKNRKARSKSIISSIFNIKSCICTRSRVLSEVATEGVKCYRKQPPKVFVKKWCSSKFTKLKGNHLSFYVFYCFCMSLNKHFGYCECTYLKMSQVFYVKSGVHCFFA